MPKAKEVVLCEKIIDRLPAWAQDEVKMCGRNDTKKDLKNHF